MRMYWPDGTRCRTTSPMAVALKENELRERTGAIAEQPTEAHTVHGPFIAAADGRGARSSAR